MSFEANSDRYISLLQEFLAEAVTPSAFVNDFFALWKTDSDEEHDQKLKWQRPFDEELIAQHADGRITGEQFSEQWARLWNISSDGKALRNVLDRIFTTCDVYNEDDNREEYELDETQFRNEIQSLDIELKAANKGVNRSGGTAGS